MTRRQVLQLGAAAAGASALGVRAQEPEPWTPRFSTSTIMYQEVPLPDALEEIAKTGCTGVDVWEGGNPHNHMDWVWQFRPTYLAELIESLGLELFAFSIYFTPGDKLEERLEWLAEAGGKVAVLGGGAAPTRPVAEGIERLMPLVEKAQSLGLRIAGENHGGSSLSTIASMREYCEMAEPGNLGLALAPYHVMGENESVVEAIDTIGDKLLFFYAWQRAEGMAELPGDGTLDFGPVMQALARVRYDGFVNIFTHTHVDKSEMTEAVIRAREYLEGLAPDGGDA